VPDAGIVEQQVDLPERLAGAPCQPFDVGADRHVDPFRDEIRAGRTKLGYGRIQRILLDVGQHQPHPEPMAEAGELPAEAAAGTGDDGDAAVELGQHGRISGSSASASRTNCLPTLRPASSPMNAPGACSRPSAIVSWYFSVPAETPAPSAANASGQTSG